MAPICSTLSGIVALKHPTLEVLVREDGAIFNRTGKQPIYRWTKGSKYKNGYLYIVVNYERHRVHRIVAEAFIANPDNKPTVDHINRQRDDNSVENLRWTTMEEQRENCCDVLFPKYGVSFAKNPLLYGRVRGKSRRQKHYAIGEIFHRCPDGKRRWHKPWECPVEPVAEVCQPVDKLSDELWADYENSNKDN